MGSGEVGRGEVRSGEEERDEVRNLYHWPHPHHITSDYYSTWSLDTVTLHCIIFIPCQASSLIPSLFLPSALSLLLQCM